MNRCKGKGGFLTRSQQRRKKQCQSVGMAVVLAILVWYGLRLVYWDASPVFVKSHRSQLKDKSTEVDMDRMKLPAFRERIELFSATFARFNLQSIGEKMFVQRVAAHLDHGRMTK